MAQDFPNNPTLGQVFGSYVWNGTAWTGIGSANNLGVQVGGILAREAYDYHPNIIINGGFDIWQRGTSAVNGIANGAFHPDRWMFYTDGVGTCNSSRVDVSAQGVGSQYAWRLERTTGTNRWVAIQVIEGALALVGKSVTLSFYVRKGAGLTSNVVADLSTRASKFGTVADYTNVTFQNSSLSTSTFTRCSVTLPITTATSSAGADLFEIEILANQAGAANAYFEITGVQLEVDTTPTMFRRAGGTIQGELAACQRYYNRLWATQPYVNFSIGFQTSTSAAFFQIYTPVKMRIVPTPTYSGVEVSDHIAFGVAINSLGITSGSDPQALQVQAGWPGAQGATYRPSELRCGSGGGYIELNSEL